MHTAADGVDYAWWDGPFLVYAIAGVVHHMSSHLLKVLLVNPISCYCNISSNNDH